MGFISNFFKVQGKNLQKAVNGAAVAFDPDGASEAEIMSFEDAFNDLLVKLGQAQIEYNREESEAKQARASYDKYMSAAEKLNAKIADGSASEKDTSAFDEVLGVLEKLKPEVDREEAEAAEAKQYLDEIKETANIMRDKLLNAKKAVDDAKRDMDRARMRKERAEIKAEKAAALAGLRSSVDTLGSASKAMIEKAERDTADAVAAEMKSEMLRGKTETASYLDEIVSDKPSPKSAADRFASLKS